MRQAWTAKVSEIAQQTTGAGKKDSAVSAVRSEECRGETAVSSVRSSEWWRETAVSFFRSSEWRGETAVSLRQTAVSSVRSEECRRETADSSRHFPGSRTAECVSSRKTRVGGYRPLSAGGRGEAGRSAGGRGGGAVRGRGSIVGVCVGARRRPHPRAGWRGRRGLAARRRGLRVRRGGLSFVPGEAGRGGGGGGASRGRRRWRGGRRRRGGWRLPVFAG